MPAFLIHDPRCVFIHNPKTGGQALRSILLKQPHEGPKMGRLPQEWTQHFTFAFVRNPFDRLISAWKMFSDGIEDTGWKVPLDLEPGMSLKAFLEIVTDESIDIGSHERAGRTRVRNHTLPQTHEYYSIDQANFVGRFESFNEDVNKLFLRLQLNADLPSPKHVTKRGPYQQYFDTETLAVATEYYSQDLQTFGYQFES